MRSLEADAIGSGRVTGRTLMERAGQGVLTAILETWPDLADTPGRAVVLCGPGNNGGDGYVVARLLSARGWSVGLHSLGDPARLPPDARANHDLWTSVGPVAPLADAAGGLPDAELVVDALFGIGLARGLAPEICAVLAAVPQTACRVAIDVPSGRDTDTGEVLGDCAFAADLVVTFHARKPVHSVLAAEGVAVIVADIGL
ncbi:MAG: NAD(P)H-hydrate epimerase [Rhodobacteraceae bacterium]|nr:NAD(P)H-hydrate epimerase [Paracoccaceae bacterium]